MRIVLGDHAKERMRERGFSITDIQKVVNQPNIKVMRADGRVEYVGMTSGRRLKLVIDEQQDPAVLVTGFWQ